MPVSLIYMFVRMLPGALLPGGRDDAAKEDVSQLVCLHRASLNNVPKSSRPKHLESSS
jgi:hypothetical protein